MQSLIQALRGELDESWSTPCLALLAFHGVTCLHPQTVLHPLPLGERELSFIEHPLYARPNASLVTTEAGI